jgi:hypothetical protein
MPLRFLAAAAALMLFALAPARAVAMEEIKDFKSEIAIQKSGTLRVQETIVVRSENDQIRHGIFRDFPTTYHDQAGNRVRVRFDVLGVTRDGSTEQYELENLSNGKRVKIGSADTLLDEGDHTYIILYETDRQIGFFADYDELYWNVTGNGWAFPILQAEAIIHLPEGASLKQYAFYTGSQGATGKDATESQDPDGAIHFVSTMPFGQGEGMTVAVGFTKGAVIPPTGSEEAASFLRDNAAAGAALLGLLALSIYYFIAWWKFGRDPTHGPIAPLFEPPKNFSPAAVRDVHRMGYDRKAFASSLIDMAVKGYLKISETGGEYTLTRTGKSEAEANLDGGEKAIARAFFPGSNTIVLKNTNHTKVSSAITGLKAALKNEYERLYFVTNRGWFIGGLVILALATVGAALFSEEPGVTTFMLLWLSGWSVGTTFLIHRAWDLWANVARGPGSKVINTGAAIAATIFAVPFAGGLVAVLGALGSTLPLLVTATLIVQGILAYVFYHLLKAPTLAGAKIRDQIDGFRMFLVTAEKDRLEKLNPPEITPQVFEKFLPYAMALDAENEWSKKFEEEAAKAGRMPQGTTYTPGWYSGSSFSRVGTASLMAAIAGSVATAAAAASSAPGSSSGSGGGGSSGGGGGGGGGGGW